MFLMFVVLSLAGVFIAAYTDIMPDYAVFPSVVVLIISLLAMSLKKNSKGDKRVHSGDTAPIWFHDSSSGVKNTDSTNSGGSDAGGSGDGC
ncbi:hypothetical protein CS022_03520 [Veronia nyctiphanis]|uniref:Uncharacterized protein n=1 Tax=Veronia nyctiphanis TaxID=1278244 RepID=A0A4Q0YZQ8_9GAMM|nr:hypothetical protein [Veronia nyctiphanis]RXJ74641.1 hypothetical protein CS022_03520 [Veronia nyctiphanis]